MVDSTTIDPLLEIPMFTAVSVVSCLTLGCFVGRRPMNASVRWFDAYSTELLVTAFLVALVAIVVVVPFVESSGVIMIFSCYAITWVLLITFAVFRYHYGLEDLIAKPPLRNQVQAPRRHTNDGDESSSTVVMIGMAQQSVDPYGQHCSTNAAVMHSAGDTGWSAGGDARYSGDGGGGGGGGDGGGRCR